MPRRGVIYKINTPKVASEIIDGEAIMINLESGNYYNLNSTGTDIWDCIEKGISLEQIALDLAQRYDGDQTQIENSVAELIGELRREELIISDGEQEVIDKAVTAASRSSKNRARQKFETPLLQKYTDMQDLLLLDPIHEVDELGWPRAKNDSTV